MYILQNLNRGDIFYFQKTKSITCIYSKRSLNICGFFERDLLTLLLHCFCCEVIDNYFFSRFKGQCCLIERKI